MRCVWLAGCPCLQRLKEGKFFRVLPGGHGSWGEGAKICLEESSVCLKGGFWYQCQPG